MTAHVGVRQVAVERLSLNAELLHLLRLGMTIVLGVWVYLASSLGNEGAPRRGLLPYQALIQARASIDQRMFRELQEGLLEAEGLRSRGGDWPTTDALAAEGVPPFAPDPTRVGRYTWRMQRDGAYVNYLGVADDDSTSWLVLVQEPEAGVPPDQNFEDEEHHRLLDGTMLHVSTWSRRGGSRAATPVVRVPQLEGWSQLYAVGPGAAAAPAARPRADTTP